MSEFDSFRRFLFEDLGVRGELVRMESSWRAVLDRHPYPAAVSAQLGQALAASVLLSGTIKFRGSLILQVQGRGALRTLVAQATDRKTVRGLARWQGEVGGETLGAIFGNGHLVLTIQDEGAEPYQGIVALEGNNLAAAIQTYFARSEQLDTRLWLAADGEHAAGLFIQELPARHHEPGDWDRLVALADTVSDQELLHLPGRELLYRMFHEERVMLFEPEPIAFRCTCSRERIEATLLALGQSEIESILADQGSIGVDCEFCNRHYRFDAVDVGLLFSGTCPMPRLTTRH